jgi:preprotein translocase subunit YajC
MINPLDQTFDITDIVFWFIILAFVIVMQTSGSTRKKRKRQKETAIQMSKSMKEGDRGVYVTVKVDT